MEWLRNQVVVTTATATPSRRAHERMTYFAGWLAGVWRYLTWRITTARGLEASMARYAAFVVASAALFSLPACLALIDTTSVSASGVSATVLAEPFGFAAGGYMDFEVDISERCVLVPPPCSVSVVFIDFVPKTGSPGYYVHTFFLYKSR